jgi:hypothetical protein
MTYRRSNSFTDEEIRKIWKARRLSDKEAAPLFPGRNLASISYLRRKTRALRIFSHGETLRRKEW